MRGDVFELPAPRGAKGHEQLGRRFAVVVQSDDLPLSTLLVAPTSTSARQTIFRLEIELKGRKTFVLVEQAAAVDPARLGQWAGRLSHEELRAVDDALRLVLSLDWNPAGG